MVATPSCRNEAAASITARPLPYEVLHLVCESALPNPSLQRTRLRSPLNSISLGDFTQKWTLCAA
jgi:hypothetical protein